MQSDPRQFSATGHNKVSHQSVSQESLVKSFDCNKCTLIFKSKVYLFEHLSKVHGLDVDAALRGAGLKYAESNKANSGNSSRTSGKHWKCQHCDFNTCSQEVFSKHECEKTENSNLIGTLLISENPDTKITIFATNRDNEAVEAEEMPSVLSVMPTPETECTFNLKDLKTYKRPSQTNIKYFAAAASTSIEEPHAKFVDDTERTLILNETSSSCSPNRSDAFEVTAKSGIDIADRSADLFFQNDRLLVADLTPKPKELGKEAAKNYISKRTKNEGSEGPPAKKAKSKIDLTQVTERDGFSKQPSTSPEFSFEVSEDEEERQVNPVNGDQQTFRVYYCKHCDYSNLSFRHVASHYQNYHPYIRYNAVYIHDWKDQSATFRCLECPVEFLSAVDLKWHYTEKHPEAPDVFKMKSRELNLAFKCFECPFTTKELKDLRRHYKERHSAHRRDNALLFCQYSVTECQRESLQLKKCEKVTRPERSGEISPERAGTPYKEAKNPPSPGDLTSKGPEVALHKCNNCEFMHKSAVVMHVHYQKKHPDEAVTIDKIKQLAHVTSCPTSNMTPEKESSKKAKDDTELSQQKKVSFSVPKQVPEEYPRKKKVESAEDQSPKKRMPRTPQRELPNEMFYCRCCNYTSTTVKSVVGHHCAKHSKIGTITANEIKLYSADVHEKRKRQSHSDYSEHVELCSDTEIECDAADLSLTGINPYAHAEKLFYCQMCNFANPSVQGVINHQASVHRSIKSNQECVLDYTAIVLDQIKKSKSHAKGSRSFSHLPLPLINEGEEKMFFCHLCNYRQSTITMVMRHYSKRHHGFGGKASHIRQYTSLVHKQEQKSPLKTVMNQDVNQDPLEKSEKRNEKAKKLTESSSGSAPTSVCVSQTQMSFPCYKCHYSAPFLFLLNRHLWKMHRSKRSVTDVLRMFFRQGLIQSGYHCQWCVFSHEKAAVVFKHFQEQHPGKKSSLEYVSTRLYVGPDAVPRKRKRAKLKSAPQVDGSLATQRSGQTESDHTVHPGSVEEDCSDVLSDKRASAKSQVEDLDKMPGLFESFQVPLDDIDETTSDCTILKCPSCPATFNTKHGLSVHRGMRHLELVDVEEERKRQVQIQTRVHIFKCPYCTYVNTSYQGVLTHCRMKHATFSPRADGLYVEITQLEYQNKIMAGDILRFSGYMCKICSHICATVDKLKVHCQRDHNKNMPSTELSRPPSALKQSAVCRLQLMKAHSIHGSVSKASFLSKKVHAAVKCQHCSYSCNTKFALMQHMYIQHKDVIPKDCIYKCVVCSQLLFSKRRLGRHYAKRHGKGAYLKYYVAVYMVPKKPTHRNPSGQQEIGDSTEDRKVLTYKCPRCPYVNARHHGTLTHCQMKHPALVIRADELETVEIRVANFVGCSRGRGSNERGYMCKRCPQIYASLMKQAVHSRSEHSKRAVSDLPTVETKQLVKSSVLEAASSKNETAEVILTEAEPSLCTAEMGQSNSASAEKKKILYKCQICSYTVLHRKSLRCHYKSTHRLDGVAAYKLMEKYNMRKRSYLAQCAGYEKIGNVKCKQCPDLMFDSSQSLIGHYNTFHRLDCKSDFTVISLGAKKSSRTGVFKCIHCSTRLNGTRMLYHHLDRHKSSMMKMAEEKASHDSKSEPKCFQIKKQDEVPTFESLEELAQWNVTSVETVALPSSPRSSPSKAYDIEPDVEVKDDGHACKLCPRTFMSLTGLRSHERSHAALAAIKKFNNQPMSGLKHNINKYVLHKPGTRKPFLCGCCSYRTTLMGFWRCHFLKNHQDVIQKDDAMANFEGEIAHRVDSKPSDASEKINSLPELDEEPEDSEESLYSEPPDVQRQLNHYSLMSQSNAKSCENVPESTSSKSSLLHCEICNFTSEHLSSIRRHYLNRHGKKILRCKDCSFFTGLQRTLEMHMETGHFTCQSEPTHQKDLRCPFCLYQTKNKNNMIDHIVLHREERLVPVQVRRPKLSRYLQGIVFRCHRCTFTSGSAENLNSHMMKHEDIKPYKCRLCYFDCTRLCDLEAHLSDKHQVLRNHELVGQVCLNQLEARTDISEEDDEHNNGGEDVETEEYVMDSDDVQVKNLAESDIREETTAHVIPEEEKKEQDESEESPAESASLDIQNDKAKSNGTGHKGHELDPQMQAGIEALPEPARERKVIGKGDIAHILNENCTGAKEKEQTNENQDKFGHEHKNKAVKGSLTTHFKMSKNTQTHMLHQKTLRYKTLNTDKSKETDIKQHKLLLDEGGSVQQMHKGADQERAPQMEQNPKAHNAESLSDKQSLDKDGSITYDQKPKNQTDTNSTSALAKMNNAQANNTKAQGHFTFERHLLTFPQNVQLMLSHKENSGVSFTNYTQEKANCEGTPEPCAKMPTLENELLGEELNSVEICKVKGEIDHRERKQDGDDEPIVENDRAPRKDQVTLHGKEGVFTATDGAAEVPRAEKKIACEFCGRNFVDSSVLKHHVMRHGM
ncbi:zinc finger protein 462-like [Leuresthes tenuis]|uniref:zinc finger protein 462-like n=1 Tax=Leuresthes tenuis TaxID=355514 RepID=UPI003B50DAE7